MNFLNNTEQNSIHPNATEYEIQKERYAHINNIQIYYECENAEQPDDRSAILLIHGWTANRLRLHPLYIQLIEAKYPVFRLDLRGHGWSQKEATHDFSFNIMKDDIDKFIQTIIIGKYGFKKVIVIAHSMGGCIAQLLAIEQPTYLEKLVLIATSANWADKPFLKIIYWLFIQYYKSHFWKKYMKKKDGHEPLGLEHFPMWGTKYNTHGRTLFTCFHATIQGLENMRIFDARKLLHNVQVPTLIIVGEKDIDAPLRYSKKIHDLIPNSELVVIPEANHDVVIGKAITAYEHIKNFINS
ncbi:MAG: alpha/beta hydrolase [Candidatus Lokiarchaeota archaeon]|nr:alpha/beta hydrolase [Candidatus Harpocratesius repetitus]